MVCSRAAPASAADAPDVLICTEKGESPISHLLRADIAALGFAAVVVSKCSIEDPSQAVRQFSDDAYRAIISIDAAVTRCRLWIARDVDAPPLLREIAFNQSHPLTDSEISLRISELMRAAFVEEAMLKRAAALDKQSDAPEAETATSSSSPSAISSESPDRDSASTDTNKPSNGNVQTHPGEGSVRNDTAESTDTSQQLSDNSDNATPALADKVESHVAPTPTERKKKAVRLNIESAVAIGVIAFEHPPTVHFAIGAALLPTHRIAASSLWIAPELQLVVPLSPLNVEEDAGTVTIRKGQLFAGARLSWKLLSDRIVISASAGVGLDMTIIRSTAAAELFDYSTTTYAALPYGRLLLQIPFSKRLFFSSGVLIGTDLPRTRITVLDKEVINTSPLFFLGFLGIDVKI